MSLNTQAATGSRTTSTGRSHRLDDWKKNDKVARLWARDASLWTGTDEGKWLGWLGVTEDQLAQD